MSDKREQIVWAAIFPDGRVFADSSFLNADDAWRVALGWPDEDEIRRAKASGYQVKRVKVTWYD